MINNHLGIFQFCFCIGYLLVPVYPYAIILSIGALAVLYNFEILLSKLDVLITTGLVLFVYLVGGAGNIEPVPLEANEAVYVAAVKYIICVPLFLVSYRVRADAIRYLMFGIYIYGLAIVGNTYLFHTEEIAARNVVIPLSGEVVNSPGLVNSMGLALCFFVLIARAKLSVVLSLLYVLSSALLLNRTGMLVGASLFMIILFLNEQVGKGTAVSVAALFLVLCYGIVIDSALLDIIGVAIERFRDEGVDSGRWANQLDGMEAVINGVLPSGGYLVRKDTTLWFHNLFLDSYRVAGYAGVLSSSLFAINGLYRACRCKGDKKRLIAFFALGFGVASTSIPLEGGSYEWYAIFSSIMAGAITDGRRKTGDA